MRRAAPVPRRRYEALSSAPLPDDAGGSPGPLYSVRRVGVSSRPWTRYESGCRWGGRVYLRNLHPIPQSGRCHRRAFGSLLCVL